MNITPHPEPTHPVPDLLPLIGSLPPVRMQPVDIPGLGRFWLKQAEPLSLRMRLQKGNPLAALERERKGLHLLGSIGLPVPALSGEGTDFLLTPDSGPNLAALLDRTDLRPADRQTAFAAAGRALAQLHLAGFAHGRPLMRDICWNGESAHLIDLERFSENRIRPWHMALDVVIFVQGWFTLRPHPGPELTAMLDAYRMTAGPACWAEVQGLARRLRLLGPVARAISRLRPRAREFRAVPMTLDHLRG
jgi:tRNA A-37 threonylcarbamoyl transferase component Bud32